MPVRHLLLDADGVLQRVAGGWRTTLERLFGDDVATVRPALEAAEAPALRGEGDFGALAKAGAVGEPGERVVVGAEVQLVLEFAVVRHVLHQPDEGAALRARALASRPAQARDGHLAAAERAVAAPEALLHGDALSAADGLGQRGQLVHRARVLGWRAPLRGRTLPSP